MEYYEKPMLSVVVLEGEDVIVTSLPDESDPCQGYCANYCDQVIVLPEI